MGFATKPALATQMLARALDAGLPASWVGYVLAVACDHRVRTGSATHRADALLKRVPARAWQQISCGKGAKGHRCHTPRPVPLAVLVHVAGRRWRIEEAFQTGKGLAGLDQHQVRRWRSWYRWATLAMLA